MNPRWAENNASFTLSVDVTFLHPVNGLSPSIPTSVQVANVITMSCVTPKRFCYYSVRDNSLFIIVSRSNCYVIDNNKFDLNFCMCKRVTQFRYSYMKYYPSKLIYILTGVLHLFLIFVFQYLWSERVGIVAIVSYNKTCCGREIVFKITSLSVCSSPGRWRQNIQVSCSGSLACSG